jgi:rifampicin phosphotransferase
MKYYTSDQGVEALKLNIGGKARNLYHLKEIGLTVPDWIVIPHEELSTLLINERKNVTDENIELFVKSIKLPENFCEEITRQFSAEALFAVRSSAIDEDGSSFSFAGQFETELYVTEQELEKCILKVWSSVFSERIKFYRKSNGLNAETGIAVIVQEMINPEVSGVAFGINPSNGDRMARIVSAVYGVGEGIVSGELDSDNYIVKEGKITPTVVRKTHQLIRSSHGFGTQKQDVENDRQMRPALADSQVLAVVDVLEKCATYFRKPQDIEFAFKSGKLYLLQSRPITTLGKIADQNGEYILWDNSNIIESYPGVTTPLTFSFISQSYEGAYKLFSGFMGVGQRVIADNERVFANTLGLINGRVYYNLKTWYHMLAMLPGYSINARYMEAMMGVKERFDIPETYRLSKGKAWRSIAVMAIRMYGRFLSLPKQRSQFMTLLNNTIQEYKSIRYEEKNANELMHLYLNFEKKLLNEWKAPLLNDFFAMIWFGLLKSRCAKYKISANPNIHNDLLCGSSDIISVQPVHRTIAISTLIARNDELKKLFTEQNEKEIWKKLQSEGQSDFVHLKKEIDQYINDFGERCIGELKLESISYTQEPAKFIKVVKSYVESGITTDETSGKIEEELRSNAEAEVNRSLRGKFLKKWMFNRTLHRARELVSSRENLRYERTRAFGIVRTLFSQIGEHFYAEGIIEEARDIFYLTKEEIFTFIEGRSVTVSLRELIALRKKEFDEYKKMPPSSERFASYGPVYHGNDFFSLHRVEQIEGDLKGIGCCPGRVTAKVRVVLNPDEVHSLDGDILVTSSTDPGWVTLFPSASAIIVERGSLLSHSAIVSREMGKPCIVGVTGLLKTLKTGDEIEMDGSTGEIKILNRAL